MAQHDYNIANGSGLTVRIDINAVLLSILTKNSGATAPATTQPFMWWYDTTTSLLKIRNAGNTAWDTIVPITAALASKLATARTISGVSFDGSANINIEDRKGTNIASAATTTIGTAGLGDYVHITGTTAITSFGTATTAGVRRTLIFDGALTLTHHATNLICMGATNIVTVANTIIEVVAETTTTWRVVSITHPALSMAELSYLDGVTSAIQTQLNGKQATLVSGTNIKTVNGESLLGSGGIVIKADTISSIFANSQTFNASGTFTVPGGVTTVLVIISGGGGGGGGGFTASAAGRPGAGGGGSGFIDYIVPVTPLQNISVVIGAGGAGGAITCASGYAGSSGSGGGSSSFGSATVIGGRGGSGGTSSVGAGKGEGSGVGRDGDNGSTVALSTGGLGGFGSAYSGAKGGTGAGCGGVGGAGGAGKVIVYW
ncbi:MAG: glycine-rich domain-containing protein [Sulfuricurvum sp.]